MRPDLSVEYSAQIRPVLVAKYIPVGYRRNKEGHAIPSGRLPQHIERCRIKEDAVGHRLRRRNGPRFLKMITATINCQFKSLFHIVRLSLRSNGTYLSPSEIDSRS